MSLTAATTPSSSVCQSARSRGRRARTRSSSARSPRRGPGQPQAAGERAGARAARSPAAGRGPAPGGEEAVERRDVRELVTVGLLRVDQRRGSVERHPGVMSKEHVDLFHPYPYADRSVVAFGHDREGAVRAAGSGAGLGLALVSAATFGTSGAFASSLLVAGWTAGAAVTVRVVLAAAALTVPALLALRGRVRQLRHG